MSKERSNWRNLFSMDSSDSLILKFIEPSIVQGHTVAKITWEVSLVGAQHFSFCLVGQFLGSKPKFSIIQNMVKGSGESMDVLR